MGRRIPSPPRQALSLPSGKTLLQIPRAKEARVARETRAARAVRERLVAAVIRDGTADMLPSMEQRMECAYATVLRVDATNPNAATILSARHPTLPLGRAMGSWSRSGPRGCRVKMPTVTWAFSAYTNTVTAKSSSRLNMAGWSRVIS